MKHPHSFGCFAKVIVTQTMFVQILPPFVLLWLFLSFMLLLSERGFDGLTIYMYGNALYYGVAAFSTAGIADVPQSPLSGLIGGLWIVMGSVLFLGTIVSVVTAYFMRPIQRPKRRIVDAIVAGLE